MSDSGESVDKAAESVELLAELNEKFKNRYTESDEEFQKVVSKPLPPPPIVHPWNGRQNRNNRSFRDNRRRDDSWNRNRGDSWNRNRDRDDSWNRNRDRDDNWNRNRDRDDNRNRNRDYGGRRDNRDQGGYRSDRYQRY